MSEESEVIEVFAADIDAAVECLKRLVLKVQSLGLDMSPHGAGTAIVDDLRCVIERISIESQETHDPADIQRAIYELDEAESAISDGRRMLKKILDKSKKARANP